MSPTQTRAEVFDELFREHFAVVLAYALRRADEETARDVAAETFVVAWRRFDQMPTSPRPWLFGVARRLLANARRGARRKQALLHRLAFQTEVALEENESHIERSPMLEALERLSANDREILQLVAWEGLTIDELATALGSSRATCRVRLHRARRRFVAAINTNPRSDTLHLHRTLEGP